MEKSLKEQRQNKTCLRRLPENRRLRTGMNLQPRLQKKKVSNKFPEFFLQLHCRNSNMPNDSSGFSRVAWLKLLQPILQVKLKQQKTIFSLQQQENTKNGAICILLLQKQQKKRDLKTYQRHLKLLLLQRKATKKDTENC